MHREDKAELLATAAQIERHAEQMLTGSVSASETVKLQRIIVLARYMREHLEMLWGDEAIGKVKNGLE